MQSLALGPRNDRENRSVSRWDRTAVPTPVPISSLPDSPAHEKGRCERPLFLNDHSTTSMTRRSRHSTMWVVAVAVDVPVLAPDRSIPIDLLRKRFDLLAGTHSPVRISAGRAGRRCDACVRSDAPCSSHTSKMRRSTIYTERGSDSGNPGNAAKCISSRRSRIRL